MIEGQKAYRIPESKREDYFNFVEKLQDAASRSFNDSGWNAEKDPVICIEDMTVFSAQNQRAIENFMRRIGAKDITEAIFGESKSTEKKLIEKLERVSGKKVNLKESLSVEEMVQVDESVEIAMSDIDKYIHTMSDEYFDEFQRQLIKAVSDMKRY